MDLVEARAGGLFQTSRHPWERARLSLVSRLIRQHSPVADGAVVLDIGCGDTFVVESLAREYPCAQFYAVDSAFTAEMMEEFARRISVPNVRLFASLDDVPDGRAASLVLLMDVLEHVRDDYGMLGGLVSSRLVDAGSRLLITVPAYSMLFCSHDRFLGHHRRYSMPTLNALLRGAGLSQLASGHLFASLVPVRLAQVLRERVVVPNAGAATGLATWSGTETTARVLARVLEWDGRLALALLRLGIHLPGLSTFAICRTSV